MKLELPALITITDVFDKSTDLSPEAKELLIDLKEQRDQLQELAEFEDEDCLSCKL